MDFIENMTTKPIFISRTKQINELKEKIVQLISHADHYYEGLKPENIKLWKVPGHASLDEIKDIFKEKTSLITETTDFFSHETLSYLECN